MAQSVFSLSCQWCAVDMIIVRNIWTPRPQIVACPAAKWAVMTLIVRFVVLVSDLKSKQTGIRSPVVRSETEVNAGLLSLPLLFLGTLHMSQVLCVPHYKIRMSSHRQVVKMCRRFISKLQLHALLNWSGLLRWATERISQISIGFWCYNWWQKHRD